MNPSQVILAAQTKIGTVEKGGKDGKSGNIIFAWDWWKSVTGKNLQGQSWCAAFVSWAFAQGMASSLIAAENPNGFIFCPNGLAWFTKRKQIVDKTKAQAGDVVFFDFAGKGIAEHVEIVESNDGKTLTTIGGNTSSGQAGSQSNGGGVYRRQRPIDKTILAVARPAWPTIKEKA